MNRLDEVKVTPTTCRSHSSRKDRECFRTCPSKLTKKELQDLYFTLLDNNLKLKKTLNSHEETIKLLSTKVHRMTVLQKNILREPKDCCAHTKALVKDHKESIDELKIVNEQMSEKIRILNMRLCSAKQLSRRSTGPVVCCTKCFVPLSGKNSSRSMTNIQRSEVFRSRTVSSNCLDRDNITTRTVDTQTDIDMKSDENPEGWCKENKCIMLKEELEQKNYVLQQELEKSHETYSNRINSLNMEITKLNSDNQRLRAEFVAKEFEMQQSGQLADKLVNRLRASEARSGELAIQLSVEKLKISELETHVRVVDTTHTLTKAIDDQLYVTNKCNIQPATPPEVSSSPSHYHTPIWDMASSRLEVSLKNVNSDVSSPKGEPKIFDDSGYADQTYDDDCRQGLQHSNNALIEKISLLQDQLFALETSANKDTEKAKPVGSYSKELTQYEDKDQIEDQLADSILGSHVTTTESLMLDNLLHRTQKETSSGESSLKEDEKKLDVDSDPDIDISNRSYTIERHNSLKTSKNSTNREINEKSVVAKFKQLIKSKENVSKQNYGKEDITMMSADTIDITTIQTRGISKTKHLKNVTNSGINAENFMNNAANDLHAELMVIDDKNTSDIKIIQSKADNSVKCASRIDTQMHTQRNSTQARNVMNRRRLLTYSKCTSPDDTDHEISSMTDLPCEKVSEMMTSDECSPGEKRAITTCSESYSELDYGSLSEGELPQLRKDRTLSNGETRESFTHLTSRGVQGMQDTLQAIGDELKRCHRLLRTHPP